MGFYLLAGKLTDLSLSRQWIYVMIAGGGIGLLLTPASVMAATFLLSVRWLPHGRPEQDEGPDAADTSPVAEVL